MERYSRQILFKPIGANGQKQLTEQHVLIVGAGALGTGIAESLARAGVGKMTIIDRDYVEWSNLQRQQLYGESDAEHKIPKAVAAKTRLLEINSFIEIEAIVADATPDLLEPLMDGVSLLLDATDNFDIRFIINDLSQKYNIPWIYGACVGSYGISYTILPGETPCLQCLLKTVPLGGATCDTVGIISPAVQMVVAHQVAEALKILTGNQNSLRKKLVSFDLWENRYSSIDVNRMKDSSCLSCGDSPSFPYLSYENQTKTAVLCGRDSVQIRPNTKQTRNLEEMEVVFADQGLKVDRNPFLLSVEIGNQRLVLFKDGRAIVHGTKDITEAKNIYYRYVG
mgnify:CR=1 FL=1